MKTKNSDRIEAQEILRKLCPPGTKLYTTVRHVARSGMSRTLDVYAIVDGAPRRLSGYVCTATGLRRKGDHVYVGGCGMDMGFHVVYELSRTLYPDGHGCCGEGCPSNDHNNGDRDYTPHATDEERTGADGKRCACHATHWHKDGGYAIRQYWL